MAKIIAPNTKGNTLSTSPKVQVNELNLTEFMVILDPGHGGLNPYRWSNTSQYTTFPAKAFQHRKVMPLPGETKPQVFMGNGWFFEGVWNRWLVLEVRTMLKTLGVPFWDVADSYKDISLKDRVILANRLAKAHKHTLYVSSHANASATHLARGYEVYSSPGDTASDAIAEWHWQWTAKLFGDKLKMRADVQDGDHDREARFYVLTQTKMPAILVEHLFFDNIHDAHLLMREDVRQAFAYAQVCTILQFIQKRYNVNLIFPEPPKLNF